MYLMMSLGSLSRSGELVVKVVARSKAELEVVVEVRIAAPRST